MTRVIRLEPAHPTLCGGYDLDAVVLEYDDDGRGLDVRFELGRGLGIYWAVPAGPGDRLRLIEVDGAAYTVDEPILHADPFVFELARLRWHGELGALPGGAMLVGVSIEATTEPPVYRCEIEVRGAAGAVHTSTLAWRG